MINFSNFHLFCSNIFLSSICSNVFIRYIFHCVIVSIKVKNVGSNDHFEAVSFSYFKDVINEYKGS